MLGIAGECCAAGEALDAEGRCCAGKLDMCGICGGATRYVDIQGVCCPGMLDSRGLCCQGALDECGICGGRNECITSVRDLSNTVCMPAWLTMLDKVLTTGHLQPVRVTCMFPCAAKCFKSEQQT